MLDLLLTPWTLVAMVALFLALIVDIVALLTKQPYKTSATFYAIVLVAIIGIAKFILSIS